MRVKEELMTARVRLSRKKAPIKTFKVKKMITNRPEVIS